MSGMSRCHFGSLSGNPNKHCGRAATKKWGDHWFCTYHGWRTPEAKQASIPCVTRLPEEPSCPSCERTREIIAARLNQSVTNDKPEVADALREILEAIRIL